MESGHTDIGPPEAVPPAPPGPPLLPPAEAPPPPPEKSASGFFLVLMLLYVALGGTAQSLHPVGGLLWTELFVFLLPPVIAAAGSNLRPAPFLLLSGRPGARTVLLGAAAGVALFLAAGGIMSLTTLVVPRSWVESFDVTRLFEGSRRHQVAMAVLASVLAPLAEEVAFRGYVLSALRTRLPPGPSIVGSALLFAVMHVDPVRFPAVLFLGLFLGWLAWRSGSIWPAVAAHAVNNGLGSLVASGGASDPGADASFAQAIALLAFGLAALTPVALAWLRATPAPPPLSSVLVRIDPAEPSVRFRPSRVPPGWAALASLGLALFAALALFRALRP